MNKKEIHLTADEKRIIAEKSGYSPYTVDQVLRGYVAPNRRHKIIFDMYDKIADLRDFHRENYMKDLEEL